MLHTKESLHTLTDISLPKYKTWGIEGDRRGDVITCLNGTLWITQEGDFKDYVLESGRSFWVTRPGSVVLQALDHSRFKYSLNELQSHVETNRQRLSHPFRS
jgi:hypothetical protein